MLNPGLKVLGAVIDYCRNHVNSRSSRNVNHAESEDNSGAAGNSTAQDHGPGTTEPGYSVPQREVARQSVNAEYATNEEPSGKTSSQFYRWYKYIRKYLTPNQWALDL